MKQGNDLRMQGVRRTERTFTTGTCPDACKLYSKCQQRICQGNRPGEGCQKRELCTEQLRGMDLFFLSVCVAVTEVVDIQGTKRQHAAPETLAGLTGRTGRKGAPWPHWYKPWDKTSSSSSLFFALHPHLSILCPTSTPLYSLPHIHTSLSLPNIHTSLFFASHPHLFIFAQHPHPSILCPTSTPLYLCPTSTPLYLARYRFTDRCLRPCYRH